MKKNRAFLLTLGWMMGLIVAISSCGEESFVPKPHGFPRMFLPEKSYQRSALENAPYQFEIPAYSQISEDENNTGKHWYNLDFQPLNANLNLTYYPFEKREKYDSMISDTRSLVDKHIQKAEDISEDPVSNYNPDLEGLVFHIQGNTASNLNFYLTDSVQHFVRGALYFNGRTNLDSIQPAFDFLWQDVQHMFKTFKWNQ